MTETFYIIVSTTGHFMCRGGYYWTNKMGDCERYYTLRGAKVAYARGVKNHKRYTCTDNEPSHIEEWQGILTKIKDV
jgi:hypothetical protein